MNVYILEGPLFDVSGNFLVSRSLRQWSTVIPSKLRKALFECQLTMKIGRSGFEFEEAKPPQSQQINSACFQE